MNPELRVGKIIESCRTVLSAEALKEADRYYSHSEPELAFEDILLELMKHNTLPPDYGFDELCALARDLGIHNDSVFDADLYTKFVAWGEAKSG